MLEENIVILILVLSVHRFGSTRIDRLCRGGIIQTNLGKIDSSVLSDDTITVVRSLCCFGGVSALAHEVHISVAQRTTTVFIKQNLSEVIT